MQTVRERIEQRKKKERFFLLFLSLEVRIAVTVCVVTQQNQY